MPPKQYRLCQPRRIVCANAGLRVDGYWVNFGIGRQIYTISFTKKLESRAAHLVPIQRVRDLKSQKLNLNLQGVYISIDVL
jgi:hypothetical protein